MASTSRPGRLGPARRRFDTGMEPLEGRTLLSLPPGTVKPYQIPSLLTRTVDLHSQVPIGVAHPIGVGPRILAGLDNEGRVLTGKDRQGDEWVITVHGPGEVIVTDATPNDGSLDDDLDTIQIIGSDPHRTYVTGQTYASARTITDGTVNFNHLIAQNGVQSIVLNGFNLTRTVVGDFPGQPANTGPEIFLPGGVNVLAFNDIIADIDIASADQPFDIVIGDPNTPLAQQPTIQIAKIFNTVFDSSIGGAVAGVPPAAPTVIFYINGVTHGLEIVSNTTRPFTGGQQFLFPQVGATGQTLVRTQAAGKIRAVGSARNFVVSRGGPAFQPQNGQNTTPTATGGTTPFQNASTGLRYLGKAEFGGTADGVGLDVNGPVGSLKFYRGLGNPTGALYGATNYGYNPAEAGNAAYGLLGGLVRAKQVGKVLAGPANLALQTNQDPDFAQLRRQGQTTYYARPGNAMTNVAITSSGSIGGVHIVGNTQTTEIAAGFDYPSFVAGLNPTRGPSQIRHFKQRGDAIDAVVSSSYSPGPDRVYGNANEAGQTDDVVGNGKIRGRFNGRLYFAAGQTPLYNRGVGFFARQKQGYLPPPQGPTRIHGELRRV